MAQFRFIGDPRANGHGPSPQVIFGLTFSRDEWTDVPAGLVEKASTHSHLERRAEEQTHLISAREMPAQGHAIDPVWGRGLAAKAAGKKRIVPPAYRGKPEEDRWLSGYDGVSDAENAG